MNNAQYQGGTHSFALTLKENLKQKYNIDGLAGQQIVDGDVVVQGLIVSKITAWLKKMDKVNEWGDAPPDLKE